MELRFFLIQFDITGCVSILLYKMGIKLCTENFCVRHYEMSDMILRVRTQHYYYVLSLYFFNYKNCKETVFRLTCDVVLIIESQYWNLHYYIVSVIAVCSGGIICHTHKCLTQ